MAKLGRNDPCPCGSGRKYKNCCLQRDDLVASRRRAVDADEALARNALYAAVQEPRFFPDLDGALPIFWAGRFHWRAMEHVATLDLWRTVEWFAHDYRTHLERRRIIDILLEEAGAQLPRGVLGLLQAWSASCGGLFRVLSVSGEELALFDSLRQEELTAHDAALARRARANDLLQGRLYAFEGHNRLSPGTIILPRACEADFVAYVRHAYELYLDDHPGRDWGVFLRENGHILNAFLCSATGAAFLPEAEADGRFHHPARSRQALHAATEELRRQQERETTPSQRGSALRRTESGLVLPITEQEPTGPSAGRRRSGSGIVLPGREPERQAADGAEEASESEPTRPHILIPGRDT